MTTTLRIDNSAQVISYVLSMKRPQINTEDIQLYFTLFSHNFLLVQAAAAWLELFSWGSLFSSFTNSVTADG